MGCDGGSIPRRIEQVKLKPKEVRADPAEIDKIRWRCCALSNETLTPPVVTCALGLLYNKEAVLRQLLEKTMPKEFGHIRALKDVMELHFKPNPNYSDAQKASGSVSDLCVDALFVCPISGLEVGKGRFSAWRQCGHVFSDKALRECASDTCLECGQPCSPADLLLLNPPEPELAALRSALDDRRQTEKKEKQAVKDKKKEQRIKHDGKATADGSAEKIELGKRKADDAIAVASSKRAVGTTHVPLKVASAPVASAASAHKKALMSDAYKSMFTSSVKGKQDVLFTAT